MNAEALTTLMPQVGDAGHGGRRVRGRLAISFGSKGDRNTQILALATLLAPVTTELVVSDAQGRVRDDFELNELNARLHADQVASARFTLVFEAGPFVLVVALSAESPDVMIELPIVLQPFATRPCWLQSEGGDTDVRVVVLPVAEGLLCDEALHALVALTPGFIEARLTLGDATEPHRTWWRDKPLREAFGVVAMHDGVLWRTVENYDQEQAVAWCSPPTKFEPPGLAIEWREGLASRLKAPIDLDDIEGYLRACPWPLPPLKLKEIAQAPVAAYMAPPEGQLALALVPEPERVVLALDLAQPAEGLTVALLHALGHLMLGHVRPGDAYGHWDTAETLAAEAPHRLWDQEARELAVRELGLVTTRRVGSLDDCTPLEKAQLGLWRMIGEALGESRRLHPAAERYQRAAYQRQGAQRLVSMLEDYGGAMLCDGVGLGKTYVATTLIVHYANQWREHCAASPEKAVEDPFRITVLAPHSVVSTWRREALPGLAAFGVPAGCVRVVSHTRLSRMSRSSELLAPARGGLSDLEHLMLSDLVLVDEAHNFRSLAARRTKVLRDLLRLQPRRELRRKVALLTATPINNSLEDLRQEVALLFSRPLWLSDAKTDDGYRRQAVKEVRERCARARSSRARGDAAPLVVHGQADARFSDTIEFRDDLDFGPNVQRIGDYLKEQDRRLKELQERIRAAAHAGGREEGHGAVRIAEELLDRIVVQRSRALCKAIERQQASSVELLFRPDAGAPEKLRYSDEFDGIRDVLARFLPLFDADAATTGGLRPLSLKVYMWHDVRAGLKTPDDTSSVVGLQRVLVLKRLESSPVSFLITLLRLAVVHAHRVQQLAKLCLRANDTRRYETLQAELAALVGRHEAGALAKIQSLAAGDNGESFLHALSSAYSAERPAADTDDTPIQLALFTWETEESSDSKDVERLWPLREALLEDFDTLLTVTPELADIVFGQFARSEWPQRFMAGGEAIDWPTSAAWGMRLVTDAKIRQLVGRLLLARRAGQKAVVFSQFSDTIAYVQSVLGACRSFSRADWAVVARGGLGVPELKSDELTALLDATTSVTGDTADRDEVVNAFAPYYRIGPVRPAASDDVTERLLDDSWEASWTSALMRPVDVLLATDVLAEGVNLQDAALLINFDVHWNPVRMIQRAGRIDRRLNPRIEHAKEFPELAALCARLQQAVPRYYWHEHPADAPATVNMILPDALEAELLLRERIATKTLAIDFTLGLEQGTGAEADWMASYKYQGISSLNAFQKDRAIEQVAGHHERLAAALRPLGVHFDWAEGLNGWFREAGADEAAPLLARTRLGRQGGELATYVRYLEPQRADGVPCWLWSQLKPGPSVLNFWLCLDGRTYPAPIRTDLPWRETSSTPVGARHLLAAAEWLERAAVGELPPQEVGRPLMQGATALSAGFFGSESDRRAVQIGEFFILQGRFAP